MGGLPGSGKTTVCQALAEQTGWRYVNAGQIFRQLAEELGLALAELGRRAEADPSIDRQLDERMVDIARREQGLILEGRLTGWMVHRHGLPAYKIWLTAPPEIRARRISKREDESFAQALVDMQARERSERQRYLEYHGIDLDDLSIYELCIDTAERPPDSIVQQILTALQHGKAPA